MPTPKAKRSERVAERIKAELMELLLRGEVRDPALVDIYVTNVLLTDDLRHARIYVRLTRSEADVDQRKRVTRALERAAGYVRRELGSRLQLQYVPDLKFFWDEGLDRAARVDAVLEELKREGGGHE